MGNGHHGARVALEKLLQPVHRFGVQVVGWLVEQQHVGLAQQQTAQRHTALLATRELANDGVPWGQAQCIGSNFQLVLAAITGSGDDGFQLGLLGRECVEIGVFIGISCVHLFQAGLRGLGFAHAALNGLAHGFRGVELRLLREVADFQARHRNGFTLELLVDTCHDLE